MKKIFLFLYLIVAVSTVVRAQTKPDVGMYNVVWDTPSSNSSESMPCGGGDIGLNVWVENGDILFYISRSGTFDENNEMLKLGRVRLSLSQDISGANDFRQTLHLDKGCVSVTGNGLEALIWVDVFRPVIHVEVSGTKACALKAAYENWRFDDYVPPQGHERSNSFRRYAKRYDVKTRKDVVETSPDMIVFYHRNRSDIDDIFDLTVSQQGLEAVKGEMYNPIRNLTFGGYMRGDNLQYKSVADGKYIDTPFRAWLMESKKNSRRHNIEIGLHVEQTPNSAQEWKTQLDSIRREAANVAKTARRRTLEWWKQFWDRSYIFIEGNKEDEHWQIARNYTIFRYQLGCNAYGKFPTKFNGGLFTFDPVFIDANMHGTPDFYNWGGGTMTAQNQRLVYWGMLRSGDFDMMKSQFDFYLRTLKNAELRTKVYWNHAGACFAEQIENFGLPVLGFYYDRHDGFDKGIEYEPTIIYQWETVFEFCMMILEAERYANRDISEYIPLIESCLTFYDEHYRKLAVERGILPWDSRLNSFEWTPTTEYYVFYPTAAAETYKMALNSTTVVCALKVILARMTELPDKYLSAEQRKKWEEMLKRIPPIPLRTLNGHKMLAPAETWQYVRNFESPQLYPVFPWGLYGVGLPDLDVAQNTYNHDPQVQKYREQGSNSWMQYPIFAARLGMTDEAAYQIKRKLKNSNRRFPTWWGPGFDWVPDHNHGGVGMIGLQEMLMQTVGEKIYLLPAFPKDWNVDFKLNAPYRTTVEATVKDGNIVRLKVTPEERLKDVVY
ncbi:MAG: DUF5703 domain-containing protein [Prevotellaceae bacterium]|jgi:hypothetical protein|nr:DUF5703 domain-containing protein [Prevotellaceae bacterium]